MLGHKEESEGRHQKALNLCEIRARIEASESLKTSEEHTVLAKTG